MKKTISAIILLALAALGAQAQSYRSSYSTNGDSVYYDGRPINGADAYTFQILGHGYAKDCHYVYLDGRVLEYADPSGFRVMDRGYTPMPLPRPEVRSGARRPSPRKETDSYYKTKWDVYYNGCKVVDAVAQSFVDLGFGYGKDKFNVFYNGVKIDGAMPSSFVIDKDGYAHDTFETYYYGQKLPR